jgi:hypothetical protein
VVRTIGDSEDLIKSILSDVGVGSYEALPFTKPRGVTDDQPLKFYSDGDMAKMVKELVLKAQASPCARVEKLDVKTRISPWIKTEDYVGNIKTWYAAAQAKYPKMDGDISAMSLSAQNRAITNHSAQQQ